MNSRRPATNGAFGALNYYLVDLFPLRDINGVTSPRRGRL
jgi:hypothetical protein